MHFFRGALVVISALFLGACSPAQQATPAADEGAIRAAVDSINRSFSAAIAARDTDKVVSFYSEDARLLPPGTPRVDGHEGVRRFWAGILQTPGISLELTTRDVIPSDAGDLVVEVGDYTMAMQGPAGPSTDVGKYVVAFKKIGGEWKIITDTFNSNSPAAAPESAPQ